MAKKKIEPKNPEAEAAKLDEGKDEADRKTAGFRMHRKTAAFKAGRKTGTSRPGH